MSRQQQPVRDESFRDSIATVDKQGKRIWSAPRNLREVLPLAAWVSWGLLALLFAGPFIRIGANRS